jgi:hypothetical protein
MSNTFAIKEVLDFTVENYSTSGRGNILFSVDYAASSNVSTTAERLEIAGGQGNFKIVDLDHSKRTMFNAMLPIVDINALAVKLGVPVTVGSVVTPKKEILTATGATPTVVLASTPLTGTLKIYTLNFERDLGVEQTAGTPATVNQYSITGKTVTLNAALEGKKVVVFYDYDSGANAQNIKLTAADFPNFITITGRGLVDDDQEGKKIPVTFKVHKAKVKPEFELTMSSTASTEIPFECDCYTILNSSNVREFIDIVKLNDEA